MRIGKREDIGEIIFVKSAIPFQRMHLAANPLRCQFEHAISKLFQEGHEIIRGNGTDPSQPSGKEFTDDDGPVTHEQCAPSPQHQRFGAFDINLDQVDPPIPHQAIENDGRNILIQTGIFRDRVGDHDSVARIALAAERRHADSAGIVRQCRTMQDTAILKAVRFDRCTQTLENRRTRLESINPTVRSDLMGAQYRKPADMRADIDECSTLMQNRENETGLRRLPVIGNSPSGHACIHQVNPEPESVADLRTDPLRAPRGELAQKRSPAKFLRCYQSKTERLRRVLQLFIGPHLMRKRRPAKQGLKNRLNLIHIGHDSYHSSMNDKSTVTPSARSSATRPYYGATLPNRPSAPMPVPDGQGRYPAH
nr:hypothetical protein [Gluconacetobacter dulcium]